MIRSVPWLQPLKKMDRTRWTAALGVGAVTGTLLLMGVMSLPSRAAAPIAPVELGTSKTFSVLAGQTVTNIGPTTLSGDLGVSPGSAITGFPPGIVGGEIHAGDAVAAQAQSDLVIAYNDAAGRAPTEAIEGDLVGKTLPEGVYKSTGPIEVSGTLTLDGQGDPNSVFIFQIASTLITATASNVSVINAAQACNVFWQVGSSATLGTGSTFTGTIMALTSTTVTTNTTVMGRALARNGAVTLDSDVFQTDECETGPTQTPTATTTATESPTETESPTNTETPTSTVTSTQTPTETESPTNTETPTSTVTSTQTPTETESPTNTETPTSTVTSTQTPTETETPTNTETPTVTNTETPTETQTQTETPTETQTQTETPTETQTQTETPTETQTQTGTQTPTETQTQTETPTETQTQTGTETPTHSETLSATHTHGGGTATLPSTGVAGPQTGPLLGSAALLMALGVLLVAAARLNFAGSHAGAAPLIARHAKARRHQQRR